MNLDIYELSAKAFIGESLTDDEKKLLREYDCKYGIYVEYGWILV